MSALPARVQEWLSSHGYGSVEAVDSVGGGCINSGRRLKTSSGATFFLKSNPEAPAEMFSREAEGLQALARPDCLRVPIPYLANVEFLLLEDLNPAPRSPDYWPVFGRRLAALHSNTSPRFGFPNDNFIGSTPQPNPWSQDGYEFFAQQRLGFQARLALERGYLHLKEVRQVETLAERLPDLIPSQPASLVHGDLWGGNAIADDRGEPALIDPAAHYGWAEAELAMTALFGAFEESFYRAYEEVRPLAPGYRLRFPIYNLYHLLNHLNLFGTSYLSQVRAVLRRYP